MIGTHVILKSEITINQNQSYLCVRFRLIHFTVIHDWRRGLHAGLAVEQIEPIQMTQLKLAFEMLGIRTPSAKPPKSAKALVCSMCFV